MQIGIDSFAAAYDETSRAVSTSDRLRDLVEQIAHADQVGLDVFGIGEHHRITGRRWSSAADRSSMRSRCSAIGSKTPIIGGEPRRFRRLIDLYRETGERFGFSPDQFFAIPDS